MVASPDEFRLAMRQLVGGVTIITCQNADGPIGLTATAVASVSADPPHILCCVNSRSPAVNAIREATHFCVNVLGSRQADLARRFGSAAGACGSTRFALGTWLMDRGSSPALSDALSYLRCRTTELVRVATHYVIIGQVQEIGGISADAPLLYAEGQFGTVAQIA